MIRRYTGIAAGILLIIQASCKREPEIPDCQINNYGIVTIVFSDASVKHSIIVTTPGTTRFREKILPKGKMSDTLNLKPDTWPVTISSLNSQGQAVDQTNRSYTTTQCSKEESSVPF